MAWIEGEWAVDHEVRTVTVRIRSLNGEEVNLNEQSEVIERLMLRARGEKTFWTLRGWKEELYPTYESPSVDAYVERVGSNLLGVVTFGVHLTAYVNSEDGLKIWVPRRSPTNKNSPNILGNSVAGGITCSEQPLNTVVREAVEEACLSEELVRKGTRSCGAISYFYRPAARNGEPSGLLLPLVPYVFDSELQADIILTPGEVQVAEYSLQTVDEVKEAPAAGRFRASSTMVLLDFLIRHGIITPENEPNYLKIISRMHRSLPFPITSQVSIEKREN